MVLLAALVSLALPGGSQAETPAPPANFQTFEEFKAAQSKPINVNVAAAIVPMQVQPGDFFELRLQVTITSGAHIYSLENKVDESLATRIDLEETPFTPLGKWKESTPEIAADGVLKTLVKIHEELAEFRLTLLVPQDAARGLIVISGTFVYRLCDNKICTLPQKIFFKTFLRVG